MFPPTSLKTPGLRNLSNKRTCSDKTRTIKARGAFVESFFRPLTGRQEERPLTVLKPARPNGTGFLSSFDVGGVRDVSLIASRQLRDKLVGDGVHDQVLRIRIILSICS